MRFLPTKLLAAVAAALAGTAASAGYVATVNWVPGSSSQPASGIDSLTTTESTFRVATLKADAQNLGFENFQSAALGSLSSFSTNGITASLTGLAEVKTANSAPSVDINDPNNILPGDTVVGRYSILPDDCSSDNNGDTICNFLQTGITSGTPANGNNPASPVVFLSLSFSQTIRAISFFGTDLGDFGGSVTVRLNYAGGAQDEVNLLTAFGNIPGYSNGEKDGSAFFAGISSTSEIQSIDFLGVLGAGSGCDATAGTTATCTGDYFGLDRITLATAANLKVTDTPTDPTDPQNPVPEPATLLLALGALGGAATVRRRRA